jgi:uncharacterized protein (TIGR00369 family)
MGQRTHAENAATAAPPATPPSPWREPVRGGYPDPQLFAHAGADQLHAMLTGDTPRPPISRLTGMQIVEIGSGTATFEMPLTDWLCTPAATIAPGALVMPADGALGCAIQTVLPSATPFTTSELSMRLLRPVPPGGVVHALGSVIELRPPIALAQVALTDAGGALIAHGSSLCVTTSPAPPRPASETAPAFAPGLPPSDADALPDPWERALSWETVTPDARAAMSGLEQLRGQLSGELPAPPIHYLTGLTLTAAAAGETTYEMPASEWFCAPPRGRVQGGAVALLAETALTGAIQTSLPAGIALTPIDLKVNYLRPLGADSRPARAHGTLVHAGRRIAVANAEVRDADDRPVAVGTGSAILQSLGRRSSGRAQR